MSQPSPRVDGLPVGLRERKKLKTRLAIQEHALRLFREQGYARTTVEQIAEAAEVSPSTFFRYFPTKEDVVLFDALDPLLIDAYRRQPPELTPTQAMRAAVREVLRRMPGTTLEEQRERGRLVLEVPELQAAWIVDLVRTADLMGALIAERVGRPADDLEVRMYTAALMGAMMAALLPAIFEPGADFAGGLEAALDYLERGLPLERGPA